MLYDRFVLSQQLRDSEHHSISLRISTSVKGKPVNALHVSLGEVFCKPLFQDRWTRTKCGGAQHMNRFMGKFQRRKPRLNPGITTQIYSGHSQGAKDVSS